MAVGNFIACMSVTRKWERGWSDNPRDPGGATLDGITLRTYSVWLKRPATVAELRALDIPTEYKIYEQLYWTPIGGDALPKGVDMMLFDIAVNNGDGREHVWAIATANLAPLDRIKRLDAMRRGFWRHLTIFDVFGKGWFNRENDVYAAAIKMAAVVS